jgi:lipase
MWKPLAEQLAARHRVLAPDLIGYGESDTWPANQAFDPSADVDIVLQLAALADGPVHIAAHSYGAAVALEAARQLDGKLGSLTLIEPVSFHLLRLAGRSREWEEISRIANSVRAAVAQGAPRSAAAIYMGFWIGRLRWWLMPNKQRRRIIATVSKVAAEFGMLQQLSGPLEAYTRISTPTRLVVGGRTRRPARAVVDVLLETMPNADRHIVPTAGHMSPFSHAPAVHELIVDHIAANVRNGQKSGSAELLTS